VTYSLLPLRTCFAFRHRALRRAARHGEFFSRPKRHAITFYNDLSKHARPTRNFAAALRRPPDARRSGDCLICHRAYGTRGKIERQLAAARSLSLPVIETQARDVSAYNSYYRDLIYRRPDLLEPTFSTRHSPRQSRRHFCQPRWWQRADQSDVGRWLVRCGLDGAVTGTRAFRSLLRSARSR